MRMSQSCAVACGGHAITQAVTGLEDADEQLRIFGMREFPGRALVELLVILAETLGNPLALLVSKAHLNKAFRAAACALLKRPSSTRRPSRVESDGGRRRGGCGGLKVHPALGAQPG